MKLEKKILIVTAWYPSPLHPVSATFVRDQTEILCKYFKEIDKEYTYKFCVLHIGFPVDLINYTLRGRRPERTQYNDEIEGFPVIHEQAIILSHRTKILRSFCENVTLSRGWKKAVNKLGGQPDMIIAVTLSGLISTYDMLQHEKLSIPVVLHEHSVPITMHIKSHERETKAISVLNKANTIVAVAHRQVAEINKYAPTKSVSIIWNPVNQDFFDAQIKSKHTGPLHIVTTGHLNYQKAQHRLISAFAMLLPNILGSKLTIIGGGAEMTHLVNLANSLGIAHSVNFTGALERSEIIKVLQTANIFVLSSRVENCPVSLLEAQAMGLPCICTVNGASELVLLHGNGLSVAQDETGVSISEGIKALIRTYDDYDAETIRWGATKSFAPEIFARRFLKVIRPLLN